MPNIFFQPEYSNADYMAPKDGFIIRPIKKMDNA